MRIVLKNIGMLKNADMELKKLSVISGENDNGKSTVGKVVFCIIKAINRYKEDLQESKEFKVSEKLQDIFFETRREIKFFSDLSNELIGFLRHSGDEGESLNARLAHFQTLAAKLKSMPELDPELVEKFGRYSNEISALLDEPEDKRKSIESALRKVFASEFDSDVLLEGESEGFIGLYDEDLVLLEVKISRGSKVQLLRDVEPIELKDATFIETPFILNNHDLLVRSRTAMLAKRVRNLGIPITTLHTKDLFDKLVEPSIGSLLEFTVGEGQYFTHKVGEVMNGSVVYDRKKRDFFYRKDNKNISIKNTASGVKVFGVLQLLATNGFIDRNSILILDEPENHLHPKWQLKLAELLVELARERVFILLSSHSPYMIEALKRFSEKSGLDDESRFYLAENSSIDNRDRLDEIFSILAEPFETFREMDAELIRDE